MGWNHDRLGAWSLQPGTYVRNRQAGPRGMVGIITRPARPSVGVPDLVWVRWPKGHARTPARHLVRVHLGPEEAMN